MVYRWFRDGSEMVVQPHFSPESKMVLATSRDGFNSLEKCCYFVTERWIWFNDGSMRVRRWFRLIRW